MKYHNQFRPDFGKYLVEQCLRRDVTHTFYDVSINHISIVDVNLFSVSFYKGSCGKEYAVTLDFDEHYLWEIMKLAPKSVLDEFSDALKRVVSKPCSIEFTTSFQVCVDAILGEPQRGQFEMFVPFNVKRVFQPLTAD
jgi:hypothetical protein